ncbi:MAG: hypothetical protein COB15_11445 [Flavobacteriales bacterium]|nr:MAG: hypothetical protein COB15_11445 [Flavobacteriales bacterium]
MEKHENLIIQPKRFTEAYYDFTPTQRDIVALLQKEANYSEDLNRSFKVDLKPYFEAKEIDVSGVRRKSIETIVEAIMSINVSFQPIKGGILAINLIEKVHLDKDFNLKVLITESALPLFYLNKITLKDNVTNEDEIPYLIEEEKDIKYIGYLPSVFVSFKSFPVKRLYELLLQYKTLQKHTFVFSKYELYLWLGFATLKEKQKDQLFLIRTYEVVENKYKGTEGWKSLNKILNKWLGEINDNEFSGVKILLNGKKYFTTKGRPVNKITIDIEYDSDIINLSEDKKISYTYLKKYNLSDKQIFKIVTKFSSEEIKKKVTHLVTVKKDHNNKIYFAQLQKPNHDKIHNVSGFVYSVVFKLGAK